MHPVLVVDFGAQYAQLIARRVREANVYSEIVPHTMSVADMLAKEPAAIILSGGPSSVYEEGAPSVDPAIFEAGVPVLGICYGFQTMAHALGGTVGLIVVSRPLYSHDKKPTPPDHAVHLLPLSHSLGTHTKPPGAQTIAKSPRKHLHRLLPKQTIMPQPQIHRHEKPPIPWTSISMSKKQIGRAHV